MLFLLHRRKNKRARGFLLELSKVAATYSPTMQCSTIGDAVSLPLCSLCALSLRPLSALCPRPSPLRCLPPLPAPLSPAPLRSALSPAPAPSPARRRRAQPTPRMAHTAPHSATPPPMRHTRGGKRRLFLPGQKRYGLSQKRSIGLSFFRATAGRARV